MDEKDTKILEMLRTNSRIKNTDIARSIGLTEGAIRARITNLLRTGAIRRFTIETFAVGVEGLILVRSEAGRSKEVVSKLRGFSDTVF
ncbi:MAG: AsnC family transcriptional regulator, partial [Thermoplasmata archaeon]|nr:AsnC family transcriptional regulator [Thermoplasmata archaeon]